MDGLAARHHFSYGRQVKGHSETSTLSSQPSIDEVRQQMHLLLEEAFSLASAGHTSSSRRHHYHQQHQVISPYSPGPSIPYSEGPTSAPDTMSHAQSGVQWVPAYGHDLYQCSLNKPVRFFYTSTVIQGPSGLTAQTKICPIYHNQNSSQYGIIKSLTITS